MSSKQIYTILMLLILTVHAQAQSLSEKYTKERPVVIVCDWDKPPYEFLNDKGEPDGSNIDVMKAVMKELDLPYRFEMKEWSIALKTFNRGQADIIFANGHRYNKPQFVVSENIVNYDRICVATHSDTATTVTFRQIMKEGAVFKPGDYSASFFIEADSTKENMEFQTPKVALMGLINNDYKYYIWGEEPLKWKIRELNLENISLNDVAIPISEIHFIGHDRQLINQIDDHYSRLKQSGKIAALQDAWIHPERVHDSSTPKALFITLGLCLLVTIVYLFNRLAKRHVIRSTRHQSELNEMMYQALHMGNYIVMQYDISHDHMTNHYGHMLPDKGLTLEEFTKRIHPDQQEEFTQKMNRLMEGRDRHFELNKNWNAGTDEQPEWLKLHGYAIAELDNEGHPAYIVNAIHNITKDVEVDRSAKELVRKYNTLSNIPFVAMSFYSKDGFLIELNDAMEELCGMTGNPENKRYWESVCMFDIPLFRNVYSPERRDELLVCQHMVYPELELDRYIEFHIKPLLDENKEIANYYVMAFDITEDRNRDHIQHLQNKEIAQISQEIEEERQHLAYLLENSDRFIWKSDRATRQITFYRKLNEPETVISYEEFCNHHADDQQPQIRQAMKDRQDGSFISIEGLHHLKYSAWNQEETWIEVSGQPVYDKEGTVSGSIGIAVDVTKFMKAKRDLEEETRLANDSVRQKSGFMASMTHELRTPLNAIVGFTGVLEALGDSPDRAEYVRIIHNSTDMLQRLINDIIEASNFTGGGVTIKPEPVDFAKAFEDICITLSQRVQDPAVTFVKENPYTSLHTTLDIGRVQQVLTNFVTNAVKFTKQGSITVGYRYESMDDDGQQGLYCYCKDTGAGIPKEKQRIVFDRFVKLDEFVQGTGMGLAISKSIVEKCGGMIGLESEGIDKGTTFWMWIPCEAHIN